MVMGTITDAARRRIARPPAPRSSSSTAGEAAELATQP
jgi:hypothetical protein